MSAELPGDFVELGEVIGGYRLERMLGAGSTSVVFLGKHVVLGRRAAIKVLVHKLIGNEDVINRLLTEAKAVNDIRHPNIIDITDFINTNSPRRVALVMEYIEGPSLIVCRENPLTFEQAIGVVLQLVAAVRAAHAAGVIHRDIKPDNLLLTADPISRPKEVPTLKIVDFGIAKMAHSNHAQTAVGTMLGTPAYMAPEQIAGRPRPSAATDVFAIGEVLYEVLTSKRAYPAGTIQETVRTKLRGELPDLKLPPMPGDKALLEIIKQCLAHRPEDRPGLQEIQNVLENVRPRGESVASIEDIDVDASEVATRMTDHKPLPPAAITELAPIGPTPSVLLRVPKDITSPTNRSLPALEIPNSPTLPGTLNRNDSLGGSAQIIRDEQSLSIGELRIDDFRPGRSDDESSVQLAGLTIARIDGPITVENNVDRDLGLGRPAGMAAFDRETDLDGLESSGDDLIESSMPTPFNERLEMKKPSDDGAITAPPPMPPPSLPTRSDSVPIDTPDTRITEVRSSNRASNRFFVVLFGVIGLGTALAILIASGRIDVTGGARTAPVRTEAPPRATKKPAITTRPGVFRIESDPANADVLVIYAGSDPLPLGKTPLEFGFSGDNLPEKLRIVHPEYDPVEVEVTPDSNHISVKLTKAN